MATISIVLLAASVNVTSTSLAAVAAFDVAFAANQIAVVRTHLRVDFPANGGGLAFNWRVPATGWPFAALDSLWTCEKVGGDGTLNPLPYVAVADPQRANVVTISPPSGATSVILRAVHTFKAPAGTSTLRLFAGLAQASASATVIVTDSATNSASYLETIVQ